MKEASYRQGGRHSAAFKRKCIKLLVDNFMHYAETTKETGVSYVTLKTWYKNYGPSVIGPVHPKMPVAPEKQDIKLSKQVIDRMAELELDITSEIREDARTVTSILLNELKNKLKDKAVLKKMTLKELSTIFKEIAPFAVPKFDDKKGNVKNYTAIFNSFVSKNVGLLNAPQDDTEKSNTIEITAKKLPSGSK